eukprot:Gb_05324 [translate_table: standard]
MFMFMENLKPHVAIYAYARACMSTMSSREEQTICMGQTFRPKKKDESDFPNPAKEKMAARMSMSYENPLGYCSLCKNAASWMKGSMLEDQIWLMNHGFLP